MKKSLEKIQKVVSEIGWALSHNLCVPTLSLSLDETLHLMVLLERNNSTLLKEDLQKIALAILAGDDPKTQRHELAIGLDHALEIEVMIRAYMKTYDDKSVGDLLREGMLFEHYKRNFQL